MDMVLECWGWRDGCVACGCLERRWSFEKTVFHGELNGEWDMHNADDLVMCLGEFNGHMGRPTDGFDGVHGGNDVVK